MIKKLTLVCAMLSALVGVQASAEGFPDRPIRLIVGFTPGGAADYVGRNFAIGMERALHQTVIVENKPGAGSSIAAEFVAHAAPDGYTILIASPSSIAVNPAINPKQSPTVPTLVPISKVSNSPLVIATNPSTGINSIAELIAIAKKDPGKLNFASAGNGSAPHLGGVLFNQVAGVNLVNVPFKGGAPAMQSVIAGDTQVTFATPPSVLPFIKSGRLRGLAVTTTERTSLVPDLPGMKEAGLPGYKLEFWYGIFAPAGTPPDVVKKLYDATIVAMQRPEMKIALAREGTDVSVSSSPADFAAFVKEDSKFWGKLAKDAAVKMD
jgi:tripartite-type tricarboxylate transporter receptor subunit TctC